MIKIAPKSKRGAGRGWDVHDSAITPMMYTNPVFGSPVSVCDFVYQRMATANQWWLWIAKDSSYLLTSTHDEFDGMQFINEGGECAAVDTPQKIYHLLKTYLQLEGT